MRIMDGKTDKKLDNITIFLDKNETLQLIGYAKKLLENSGADHFHLSSEDYQKEITICLYSPETVKNFSDRV